LRDACKLFDRNPASIETMSRVIGGDEVHPLYCCRIKCVRSLQLIFTIDTAGAIGQTFGTMLAQQIMQDESQFAQIAAGTVISAITRNIAETIANTALHFDQSNFDFLGQFDDFNVDLAGAALGSVSSFLYAELGEAVGLEGFGAYKKAA
jgi:hypothetical protein